MLKKIMILNSTSGRIVFIAGGDRSVYRVLFYCGMMTIGVPGLGTDGQSDRQREIFIAGGERSVYWDSGWIVSRKFFIAG